MYIRNRQYLLDSLCGLLGGRVAEELKFNEISSGAANDIEKATKIVHQMVCEFGMSDKLGPITYGENNSMVFLGRDINRDRNYSEETSRDIDMEIKRIIGEAHERTRKLLQEHAGTLEILSRALLEHETLDASQFDLIFRGQPLPPPLTPRKGAVRTPSPEQESADGTHEPVPSPA